MVRVSVGTDRGYIRTANEDNYVVLDDLPEVKVYAVADGLGGCEAGEVASRLAVEELRSFFTELPKERIGPPWDEAKLLALVQESICRANRAIHRLSTSEPGYYGMGTTLTVAVICRRRLYVGHIGDSRLYIVRAAEIRQVTNDHSVVAELVRSGRLREEDAMFHPYRNVLTRVLGTDPDVLPDMYVEPVCQDDIFLLCTDGLTSLVDDETIREVLVKTEDFGAVAGELVRLANERGGYDNTTVVAVRAEDTEERDGDED